MATHEVRSRLQHERDLRHSSWRIAGMLLLALVGACRGGASRSPADCMRNCDQKQCQYKADSLGDNGPYLECLRSCEQRCSR